MHNKFASLQLPSTLVSNQSKISLIKILFYFIKNVLALLGFLGLGVVLFVYFQGQQLARSFSDEFIGFFGMFVVEQVLRGKDVASTMIIKTKLEQGVTIEQAISAMKNYANQLKFKLITSYPLYKDIEAKTGKSSRFVEIFEFCDAAVVASLLEHNPDFATYLPCRIAIYEDNNGQIWFATMDMELLFHGTQGIEPLVKVQILKIQENLLKIMGAGAHGTK